MTGTEKKERQKMHARRWYEQNRERHLIQAAEWKRTNPLRAKEIKREWQLRNPEKVKESSRKWKQEHREEHRADWRRWAAKYPEKAKANQRKNSERYRVRKLDAFIEDVDPKVVYEMHGGRCGICGEFIDLSKDRFHVDHVIPLSRGGKHSYINVQPAHPICNLKKEGQLQEEMT